jgi:sulfur relay (sulfurtransferase) complex TusBCD TusD component (DsrE family)
MNISRLIKTIPVLLLLCAAFPAGAADAGKKLFINLTSDDGPRAAMAIGFGTRVLQERQMPVTIFLNVEGVRLANKNIAQCKVPQELLRTFIKHGGRVVICPMCLQNVGGMDKDDLISGVTMGGPDVTWPALFDDNVTVLSY